MSKMAGFRRANKWRMPDGSTLERPKPWTDEHGIQYPAQIFRLWSDAELIAHNIRPIWEMVIDKRWFKITSIVENLRPDGCIERVYTTDFKRSLIEFKRAIERKLREQYFVLYRRAKDNIDWYTITSQNTPRTMWIDYHTSLNTRMAEIATEVKNAGSIETLRQVDLSLPNQPEV